MTNEVLFSLKREAVDNLRGLGRKTYPGRGAIAGLDETGRNLVQVYWIMGRSDNSRNRVFTPGKNGLLFTDPVDPSTVKDPHLVLYNAMREVSCDKIAFAIVSNGSQTDHVAEGYLDGKGLEHSMHWDTHEPDTPNYTPRITAVSYWLRKRPNIRMALLRKSPWGKLCDRHLFEISDVGRGFGYCFHTYADDGDPLPPFRGEPYLVPLLGDAEWIAETYWGALDPDNRVSLAVKMIPRGKGPSKTSIINKFQKAA